MTLTLTAMRGYPGSGKSTKAREIANETGAVVVCRVELRKMLHDNYFTGNKDREAEVTVAERAQVSAFLKNGTSVIVDATHLEPSYLRKWAKMASQYGAKFERVDMDTPAADCIRRDHARQLTKTAGRVVGEDVIKRMAKRHPQKNWPDIQAPPTFTPVPVEWVDGLPEAIIVDIDGTVAHMDGRSPYDYTQVHTDTVDEHVRWLVNLAASIRYDSVVEARDLPYPRVLFVSGRDDSCRDETVKWLANHGIQFDELHMRPTGAKDGNGNKLPDYLVKSTLFDENIRGKYNVRFVLDDRDQVVNLWRSLGLKCLQVQPGDF
ncbi:AAA family ATPase [Mycolicibacterium sphagni]|uniref:Polynucleotide kinase n=1 Tax=Mycolicibacterium sphagni TaxID=1786 RepID=A0A255DQQ0_9MYCO|nr:AAA family ATPase [Mycolicibacterium sphagni]OYN81728.1 polynucleotide kinase [Mycolicibacterium sphagni]